jgi:nitroimidazol reductase NimA-like FMN-containing flavoprotein (pyridoxamine 5'-phosphate oxidase superfamily)
MLAVAAATDIRQGRVGHVSCCERNHPAAAAVCCLSPASHNLHELLLLSCSAPAGLFVELFRTSRIICLFVHDDLTQPVRLVEAIL